MNDVPTDELTVLLKRRLSIIADHDWRHRDPAGHLDALKDVSERISAWNVSHRGEIDARLRHFLANASFDKALAHIEGDTPPA